MHAIRQSVRETYKRKILTPYGNFYSFVHMRYTPYIIFFCVIQSFLLELL